MIEGRRRLVRTISANKRVVKLAILKQDYKAAKKSLEFYLKGSRRMNEIDWWRQLMEIYGESHIRRRYMRTGEPQAGQHGNKISGGKVFCHPC